MSSPTPNTSLAQQLAALPLTEQAKLLKDLDPDTLQYDWNFWARPSQILPDDNSWHVSLLIAGRGSGKTRAGNEWIRDKVKKNPGARFLLVARTASDVRDVLILGESGIINIHPPSEAPTWAPSKRLLEWPNGCTALAISADNPDLLRGIQSHFSLADEIATWDHNKDSSGLTAWDNLLIATRLGLNPQIVAMTTPKRNNFMKNLTTRATTDPRWILRTGSTYENAGNLSENYLTSITALYEGTSLAQQELFGEMFDGDLEGTLFTQETFDASRVATLPSTPLIYTIGVDPSVAERPRDECGIIVAAMAHTNPADPHHGHCYLIEDASLVGSPAQWSQRVIEMARKYSAPVTVETNQGGAMVRQILNSIDPSVKINEVTATQSKRTRAEPIALLFEQNRAHIVGHLPLLEEQATSWQPEITKKSPDRLDAAIWALSALSHKTTKGSLIPLSKIRAISPNRSNRSIQRPAPRSGAVVLRLPSNRR